MIPLCQTLSKFFEISRLIAHTSNVPSKDLYILWIIVESRLMQESHGLKGDWFEEINSFSIVSQKFLVKLEALRLVGKF